MIEACGLGGSGKTELLIQTAVGAILPRVLHNIPFNGSERGCVLIDLDAKFDTLRFWKSYNRGLRRRYRFIIEVGDER